MKGKAITLRSIALLAAASAGVHELRYLIAYGEGASRALDTHPHGYLSVALPGVITVALIVVAAAVFRVAGGRSASGPPRHSLLAAWFACTALLALIYGTQETLEGAGAIAGSGWIGLALALPFGLLVALTLRGADSAEPPRVRGAGVRAVLVAAAAVLHGPAPGGARAAAARIRARGPPLPFVV